MVIPVALSFRLLGIGVWQARLPIVLFGVAAVCGLYSLGRCLFDQRVGLGAVAISLLLPLLGETHPILMSRQVLGEVPMLCFLVWGIVALFGNARGKPLGIGIAAILFALALHTKAQALPFLLLSLLASAAMAFHRGDRCTARSLAWCIALTVFAAALIMCVQRSIVSSRGQLATAGQDPYNMVRDIDAVLTLVVTPSPVARLRAVVFLLVTGIPTIVGILAHVPGLNHRSEDTVPTSIGHYMVWTLTSSWLVWFLFVSIAYLRYIFPILFIGSIFVAATIGRLAHGDGPPALFHHAARSLRTWPPTRSGLASVLLTVVLSATAIANVSIVARMSTDADDLGLTDTASLVNEHTPPSATIETYESELFFLLDRPYHYPPDEVQHRLNRRTFLGQDIPIEYDALTADPDYLIVGDMARMWHLYDDVLSTGAFRPLETIGRYEIYERFR
ncbi:MAG: hypothetical protein GX552_14850 [Chloroflexi bacterium]|nr:hypothetical protein [Chloroflexota bacterium]